MYNPYRKRTVIGLGSILSEPTIGTAWAARVVLAVPGTLTAMPTTQAADQIKCTYKDELTFDAIITHSSPITALGATHDVTNAPIDRGGDNWDFATLSTASESYKAAAGRDQFSLNCHPFHKVAPHDGEIAPAPMMNPLGNWMAPGPPVKRKLQLVPQKVGTLHLGGDNNHWDEVILTGSMDFDGLDIESYALSLVGRHPGDTGSVRPSKGGSMPVPTDPELPQYGNAAWMLCRSTSTLFMETALMFVKPEEVVSARIMSGTPGNPGAEIYSFTLADFGETDALSCHHSIVGNYIPSLYIDSMTTERSFLKIVALVDETPITMTGTMYVVRERGPGLTHVGLAVLAVLLLLRGAHLMWRRRSAMTSAV